LLDEQWQLATADDVLVKRFRVQVGAGEGP
jgi:hypothetical protein